MSVTPNAEAPSTDAQVDQAVAQGGAYDVLRRRLDDDARLFALVNIALADAAKAHSDLAARRTVGSTVILP